MRKLDMMSYSLSKNYGDSTFIAKAGTAPAAGLRSVLGIDNGETSFSSKALFDATAPSTQALGDAAAVGSALAATLDYTPVAGSELDPAYNGSATC